MQDKVPNGPSRTPRPAHPAELAADRLMDVLKRYHAIVTVEEYEILQTARKVLWRIAREDEK